MRSRTRMHIERRTRANISSPSLAWQRERTKRLFSRTHHVSTHASLIGCGIRLLVKERSVFFLSARHRPWKDARYQDMV